MYIVVCYDITNNRRRTRLHEMLLGHGTAVQKSVFECDLTRAQLRRLRTRTRRFVKDKGDSIRYYQMCSRCVKRTQADGTALVEPGDGRDYAI